MWNNKALWTVQIILGAMFIFAGAIKIVAPPAQLTDDFGLATGFVVFIGIVELAGGVGVILPWLLKIQRYLTPLAGLGLVVVMIGATVFNGVNGEYLGMVWTVLFGLASAYVAYGRRPEQLAFGERRLTMQTGR